mmetsp:Transcript_23450/g.38811  ORF Transcript_23450/g.38811 Transcript_23450/m.38811 type:complete len:114 (-) Transcript_23450:195-536(-)
MGFEGSGESAEVTHNHSEGIKGAQAIVAATYLARSGKTKDEICTYVVEKCGYILEKSIEIIRPYYNGGMTCQETVPYAIVAFLDSDSFEDCLRKAISLGGDTDTIAFMAGAIA